MNCKFDELDKLKNEFDELDKLKDEFDELDKLKDELACGTLFGLTCYPKMYE